MTDPIADMLTRIRNASLTRKAEVLIPYSKIKLEIAKILVKEGYIISVEVIEENFKSLKIVLKYNNKQPAITGIRRVSKVGQRIYVGTTNIPRVLSGYGLSLLSTSKGVISGKEARKAKVGGELICEVY